MITRSLKIMPVILKRKRLCSKRREIDVCSLKWLFHVSVTQIKYMQHLQGANFTKLSPTAFNTKTQKCSAQQYMQAASLNSRTVTDLQRFGHIQGPIATQAKDLFQLTRNFLPAKTPLLCTLLGDAGLGLHDSPAPLTVGFC